MKKNILSAIILLFLLQSSIISQSFEKLNAKIKGHDVVLVRLSKIIH
jgi:hypothetical protein